MPRPPPSRAITGCCTCAPRPTPNRRSSRPPASISTSISSASLPSSPAHPIHLSPPHSQPFTTSSTRSASPDVRQHARAPVVLDFLYPGFGFFSRSLPPVVSSASSTNPTVVPGLRPPPSPPPGADATTDFSIYRSQEGREIGSLARSSSHPGQTAASRWMTVARVRPGACVCGRVRETCLRCRASSTAASIASGRSAGGVTASRTDKGKRKEVVENDSPLEAPSSPASSPTSVASRSPTDAIVEFRAFFKSLDSSLPSSRAPSLAATLDPTSPVSPTRRRLARKRSNLAKSTSNRLPLGTTIERLSACLRDVRVWNGLSYYEKLDAIRLFARLARLSQPSSLPSRTRHDPLDATDASSSISTTLPDRAHELEDEVALTAGREIETFLRRLDVEEATTAGSEGSKRNPLSEAGLWIDSFSLRRRTILDGPSALAPGEDRDRFLESIRLVFDWDRPHHSDAEKRTQVQAVRTGFSSLLDSWERSPAEGGGGAAAAFKLVYDFDLAPLFETTVSTLNEDQGSKPSRQRQDAAYGGVLRRRYGLLLGRLSPSPSEWVQARADAIDAANGTLAEREAATARTVYEGYHLVEFLATSGSAGEARKIWDFLERHGLDRAERSEAASSGEMGSEEELEHDEQRVKTLTALVDGLTMEGFFQDANSLASDLEALAKQLDGRAVVDHSQLGLVLNAFRVLAKLASDQGRLDILERLLKKVDSLVLKTDPSTSRVSLPPPSLESFARRLRSKSARHDVKSVRSLFASFKTTPEWERAPKEQQARLWAQVILAETRINDVERAVKSLQSVVESGLTPTLASINSILFGFARRGDVATVDDLFQQLARGDFDHLRPDVGSWNSLVLARTVTKDPTAASNVIVEMQKRGLAPNRQTWTTLMAGLVDVSQWRQAFEIYRFLEQHPAVDMRPDTATTNVALKACVLTATPAALVLSLFRQLLARGFRPNMMTYTLVLQSLTSAGLMDLAEELYLLMDRPSSPPKSTLSSPSALPVSMAPVRPDQFIFSTLIAGYLRQDETAKAKACLAEMRRRGIEPSSITLAIVVGSRLNRRSTPTKVKQLMAEARALLRDEGSGLMRARKSQSSRRDRKLAMGDEAVAIFAPIFRSAAKQGLAAAALELLEEVQSRRTDEVPVELYTMLMDAFKRVDDHEAAADNVKTVWDRVYESVAERFMTIQETRAASSSSMPLPSQITAHILTTSRHELRIDPAQASILRVPLTIFLETLARVGRHHLLGLTWRALARQGFAFDVSNWNTLATYFARDLQLERAFWIAEHVLCRPRDDTSPIPSPERFEAELANVTRSSAVMRTPSRLSSLRQFERDQRQKDRIDLASLFSAPTGGATPSIELDISATFNESLKVRESTFWHPYGTLLEALEASLESLTLTGDVGVVAGGGTSAIEIKDQLVKDHPRTMKAIALWRSRGERKEREKERYLSVQGRSL